MAAIVPSPRLKPASLRPSGILAYSGSRIAANRAKHQHGHIIWITAPFFAMRWLMIGLLVSLGALLFAAGALARHIWLQRASLRSNPDAGPVLHLVTNAAVDPVEEADQELEP
ncbi:MAG: hypothetical protein ABSG62_15110 [Terracidiphilus sp.]|jgi:hypothetical protein